MIPNRSNQQRKGDEGREVQRSKIPRLRSRLSIKPRRGPSTGCRVSKEGGGHNDEQLVVGGGREMGPADGTVLDPEVEHKHRTKNHERPYGDE